MSPYVQNLENKVLGKGRNTRGTNRWDTLLQQIALRVQPCDNLSLARFQQQISSYRGVASPKEVGVWASVRSKSFLT